MNNFASLVDIFLHYARPKQTQGLEADGAELAVSMKSMSTFVRTCRLSSEHCSFFEIQRACVRCSHYLSRAETMSSAFFSSNNEPYQRSGWVS
jgi:hypothetical protein